jgi:hypothetical protein
MCEIVFLDSVHHLNCKTIKITAFRKLDSAFVFSNKDGGEFVDDLTRGPTDRFSVLFAQFSRRKQNPAPETV